MKYLEMSFTDEYGTVHPHMEQFTHMRHLLQFKITHLLLGNQG